MFVSTSKSCTLLRNVIGHDQIRALGGELGARAFGNVICLGGETDDEPPAVLRRASGRHKSFTRYIGQNIRRGFELHEREPAPRLISFAAERRDENRPQPPP